MTWLVFAVAVAALVVVALLVRRRRATDPDVEAELERFDRAWRRFSESRPTRPPVASDRPRRFPRRLPPGAHRPATGRGRRSMR